MLTFDFETYTNKKIPKEGWQEILKKVEQNSMSGFLNPFVPSSLLDQIKSKKEEIKKHSQVLVVVGAGGSFAGCRALDSIFSSYWNPSSFSLLYAGYQLSEEYLERLKNYLKEKEFSINVISKSGTTLETNITYQSLLAFMKTKYTEEELKQRIFITSDENSKLKMEADQNGYTFFPIPKNIGGRYSLLTAVGLFPLSLILDIEELLKGAQEGKQYIEEAYQYACLRKAMYDEKRGVENFVFYEEKFLPFGEWLKQLFSESEGKKQRGILPISSLYTRDLHSLGQFLQEGNPIVFETVIDFDGMDSLQQTAVSSVCKAHQKNTPSLRIHGTDCSVYTMGQLIYFFFLSASFSAVLMDVDPFDQPGVEAYKEEMRNVI